jgi:hypothetical protein
MLADTEWLPVGPIRREGREGQWPLAMEAASFVAEYIPFSDKMGEWVTTTYEWLHLVPFIVSGADLLYTALVSPYVFFSFQSPKPSQPKPLPSCSPAPSDFTKLFPQIPLKNHR